MKVDASKLKLKSFELLNMEEEYEGKLSSTFVLRFGNSEQSDYSEYSICQRGASDCSFSCQASDTCISETQIRDADVKNITLPEAMLGKDVLISGRDCVQKIRAKTAENCGRKSIFMTRMKENTANLASQKYHHYIKNIEKRIRRELADLAMDGKSLVNLFSSAYPDCIGLEKDCRAPLGLVQKASYAKTLIEHPEFFYEMTINKKARKNIVAMAQNSQQAEKKNFNLTEAPSSASTQATDSPCQQAGLSSSTFENPLSSLGGEATQLQTLKKYYNLVLVLMIL